jgi:hypothetical protein
MTDRAHGTRARYAKGPAEDGTPGRGCLCAPCTRAGAEYRARRARLIAYGRWEHRVDATGTRRRVQALAWCGWSLARLSARLGGDESLARKILRRRQVTAATARAVRELYDELWDQAPPEDDPWDARAAVRARNYARTRGFAPPQAWDDDEIDDPAASPAEGWERQGKRRYGSLTEEAVELNAQGEHPEMIAARLGSSVTTVQRTLERVAAKEAA